MAFLVVSSPSVLTCWRGVNPKNISVLLYAVVGLTVMPYSMRYACVDQLSWQVKLDSTPLIVLEAQHGCLGCLGSHRNVTSSGAVILFH